MKPAKLFIRIAVLAASLLATARAQTLTDLGAANPVPGTNDIFQLGTNGNQMLTGAFNYFTDNANPPGQTFTAGTNPLVLTSVSLRTGSAPTNSGNGGLGPQPFQLRLFSVASNTATLLNTYTSSSTFSYADGDWVRWDGFFTGLSSNATYAYSFQRVSNGWGGLAVSSGNLYNGGEVVLIPNAGGALTYQSSRSLDAAFSIGLARVQTNVLTTSTFILEAERALLTGSPTPYVTTATAGYSGTGYVSGIQDSTARVNWSFTANPGLYRLTIRFRSPFGQKGFDANINGHGFSGMFPQSSSFVDFDSGLVQIVAGANTLQIGGGWTYFEIDRAVLTPATAPAPPLPVAATLCDSNATFAARMLMKSLVADYGKVTWAGQHNSSEVALIQNTTGRKPVIVSGDLIDYSPTRVQFGGMPANYTESQIALETSGHVLGLIWHWNAPTNLINTVGHEWWRAFYTDSTTFDVSAALANTNSAEYAFILRDIDAIAVQLKKVSSNNIPILWRPLHEASGGWFWWGAKGSGPFKALWRLLYQRLTIYHNLHNMIWVCTNIDPDWYPGDDVVDILSVDDYPSDITDPLQNDWNPLLAQFNGKKLIALSEFGGIPDIERMHLFGVWFSYFAPWTGDYIESAAYAPPATMTRIYNSSEVIVLDEMNARPPVIVSNTLVSGAFQLAGIGPRGAAYRILASTNLALARTNWLIVSNGIFAGGVFNWNDTKSTNYSKRFYQIATP